MRRPIWAYLLVLSLCVLFGGFTWLTRNPDAEILDRVEEWPYVGAVASRFKAVYRQPADRPSNVASDSVGDPARAEVDTPSPVTFSSRVYVLKGQELKQRPVAESTTLHRFENHTSVGKIERRGDWYHVHYHGRQGWVLLEGYDEDAAIPYGETTDLPVPVAALAPDAERLAAARKLLRGQERVLRIGPYVLYTDSRDEALIATLDAVAAPLDALYCERYGRTPTGAPAEAVVLYQSDIAYRLLRRQTNELAGLAPAGHNSKGVAVLYVGSRRRSEVTATLVHELVHFINRRAIGPQLPPWLDEGLADGLAQARIDEEGVIHPGELGGARLKREGEFRLEGAFSTLWKLREAARGERLPTLEELTRIEWERFVQPTDSQLHYGLATFWIRYLLDGDGSRHGAAFRQFLGSVAAGEPPEAATLQAKLGEDWNTLDEGFFAWIEHLAKDFELPDDAG